MATLTPKKTSATRSKINSNNVLKVADSLQEEHNDVETQHRQFIYRMMGSAAFIIRLVRQSNKLAKRFMRHAKLEKMNKGVATAVIAYIMQAKSKKKRQLAWKRGRAVEYLLDQGVKPAAITKELKKRGGLEAICKAAAHASPRRTKKATGTNCANKSQKPASSKGDKLVSDSAQNKRGSVVAAQDPDHAPDAAPLSGQNDRFVTVWVPMLMKLSDRDALDEMPAKAKVKIVARCINEADAKLKVRRIQKLTAKTPKSDESSDWD